MPTPWFLQPDGALATSPPVASGPDRYRYDPADPTPSVGGIGMLTGGATDNRMLEQRPDVLVYTSDALGRDVEVIGDVSAGIWFQSSLAHADVAEETAYLTQFTLADQKQV